MFKIDSENLIEYPCSWEYKVIGENFSRVSKAIAEVLADKNYSSKKSNMSSRGTYVSIRVELIVENEDIRNAIFYQLKQHEHIKMVL